MKKIYIFIITILMLIIPINIDVHASDSGIKKFYMDATVEKDGSILVKELFALNGEYNGFERIINYRNSNAEVFNKDVDMYGGSNLHNAYSLETIRLKGIVDKNLTFNSLHDTGIIYKKDELYLGNQRTYREISSINGKSYRIYNPSQNKEAFYLEYRLKNMAIVHNDIAELGWNIFSDQLTEDVKEFELLLHIPENKNELRAWAHGPLNGNVKIIDKQTVKVTIKNLSKNTAFDVRLVFDKEVINESSKLTNVKAFDKILKYEEEKAQEANRIRQQARTKYYGSIGLYIIWVIVLLILWIKNYLKNDKEYQSNINVEYYREFPNTYGPEIVGFLMNKSVGTKDLSAAIMNLIYKKVISAEQIGDKKDYRLTYNPEKEKNANLTVMDTHLIKWMFRKNNTLLLSSFKREAKNDYDYFLSSYDTWKNLAEEEGKRKNFYLNHTKIKTILICYSLIGFICGFLLIQVNAPILLSISSFIISIITIIYFANFQKKTKYGNDEYVKWRAFKKFLLDFGNFSEKELPEIVLWEKYLVYAVTLGCAKKLAKTMEIKIKEYNQDYYYSPINNFYYINSLNNTISSSVNGAVNTAISTRAAAQSSNSSSGGFGGGFSSGGGSFGGGGGGGRF